MARSRKSYIKREPKNKTDFKGASFNCFCGFTCCGFQCKPSHPTAKKEIRIWRNNQKKIAIAEGLREWAGDA